MKGFEVTFTPAGHILGSACVHVHHKADDRTVVFSGDVGRQNDLIMRAPEPIKKPMCWCVNPPTATENTGTDPETELADIISRTAGRGGIVLIPALRLAAPRCCYM